jgi:hypothetical protein
VFVYEIDVPIKIMFPNATANASGTMNFKVIAFRVVADTRVGLPRATDATFF